MGQEQGKEEVRRPCTCLPVSWSLVPVTDGDNKEEGDEKGARGHGTKEEEEDSRIGRRKAGSWPREEKA